MQSVVPVAVAMGIIFLSLVFHELGHLLAKQKYGLKVKEMTIGLPIVKKLCYRFTLWNTDIVLSPFLFGASTVTDEKEYSRVKTLPYDDQAFIYGAGIMGSIFFAGAVLIINFMFMLKHDPLGAVFSAAALMSLPLISLWYLRRYFCSYIILLLGVAEMAYLTIGLFGHIPAARMSGAVGLGSFVVQTSTVVHMGVIAGVLISLLIAAAAALPFHSKRITFDAGHIMEAFLKGCGVSKRWMQVISMTIQVIFITLCEAGVYHDFVKHIGPR